MHWSIKSDVRNQLLVIQATIIQQSKQQQSYNHKLYNTYESKTNAEKHQAPATNRIETFLAEQKRAKKFNKLQMFS